MPATPRRASARRSRAGAAVLLAILALCSPACRRTEPPADITIVNGAEPESLDPAIVTGVPEMRVTKALFDGLTRLDSHTARPVPALAERWDVSPDGRSYTFHLRADACWSTGERITAQDVAWSWRRTLAPATGSDYAGQLFCIAGAEAFYNGQIKESDLGIQTPDDRTVVVTLKQALPFFLDLCAVPAMAVVPRQAIERYGDRWLHARPLPVSGAFDLGAWRLNDRVRLVRNPRYWDAAHTVSQVIDVLPIGSPATALNLYETGGADVVWDKDLIPAELVDVLQRRPDFHSFALLGTYFVRFNVTRPPFTDARVRRAFALATDKGRLVRKLFTLGEEPALQFVPDSTANYHRPDGLRFDRSAARALLAEAGFPDGKGFPRVRYSFPAAAGGSAKMQGKVAIELQQMWREELGIDVDLRQVERKIFYHDQSQLDYDISGSSWIADYNDPNTFLDIFTSESGNNRTGWKNPRYDGRVQDANRETDLERRADLFRQAETILVNEDAPIVPLYFFEGFNCYDTNKVTGIFQNGLDEHPLQAIGRMNRSR
jgi:oligopeptide transport system substrate-binding protein